MIRALLVIDVPLYREGLAVLIAQSTDVAVAGTVCGVASVTQFVEREAPDVVLLDISAPDARETLASLGALPKPANVVALAINETPESVAEWAGAGVLGYVSRGASLADLLQCMRCAVRGEAYCSPRVMSILLRRLASLDAQSRVTTRIGELTMREREILELLGCGLSNKVIAARLHISHATAKNHVHHILDKLQLRSRTEAASYLHAHSETRTVVAARPAYGS